jgi:phenylacetate-CoA ligase
VEIELARTLEDSEGLVACIHKRLKQQLGITTRVKLLAPGSLPRSEGKTKRVVREY